MRRGICVISVSLSLSLSLSRLERCKLRFPHLSAALFELRSLGYRSIQPQVTIKESYRHFKVNLSLSLSLSLESISKLR